MTADLTLYDWRYDARFTSAALVVQFTYTTDVATLNVTWEPFRDDETNVTGVAYCFGTAQYRCDVIPQTAVAVKSTVDAALLSNLTLTNGSTYYATVWASNLVGLTSVMTSPGVLKDARPPSPGVVYDGPPAGYITRDIDCEISANGVSATWTGFAATTLGLDHYDWAVGTRPGGTDLQAWTSVGMAVQGSNSSILPLPGTIVYASVRAVNIAGTQSVVVSSNGVRYICPADGVFAVPPTGATPAANSTAPGNGTQSLTTAIANLCTSDGAGYMCVGISSTAAVDDGLAFLRVPSV